MLRTNSKQALQNLREYIVRNTDAEPYGFAHIAEFKDAAKFIMTAFYIEKVRFDKRHLPMAEYFKEWMQGLPSIYDAEYYYRRDARDDVAEILEETDAEKNKYTEEQATELLTDLIWREVYKACNYEVKIFPEWEEE